MKPISETTILIADDEQLLCNALASDFKRKGYKTLAAYNGRDALEMVKNNPVDLVISDIRMPDGDGVELLNNVKNINHALPVVLFITGFADITLAEAYDKGVEAIFSKPFNRKALMAAVESALIAKDQRWEATEKRVETDIQINLKVNSIDHELNGRMINFGRGGMFIALEADIPKPDSIVQFRIVLDANDPTTIEGEGIVRWNRTSPKEQEGRKGCGIEFITLNESARKQIFEWTNSRRTKAFIPMG